jgi:hypothetical protein
MGVAAWLDWPTRSCRSAEADALMLKRQHLDAMRTTLTIDDELLRQLRQRALDSGKPNLCPGVWCWGWCWGVVRISTQARLMRQPLSPAEALDLVEGWLRLPTTGGFAHIPVMQ